MSKKNGFRIESDHSGEVQVPSGVYWGARTQRALECFSISGSTIHKQLVRAIVYIKKAASQTNGQSNLLDPKLAQAISQACDEILSGMWQDNFVIDAYAPSAFQIANLSEIIANRASEMLGGESGNYTIIHPQTHVDAYQPTNDVFPTAMRLAVLSSLKDLSPVVLDLERLLRRKALELARVTKLSRTHTESQPTSLGQEFNSYASSIQHGWRRLTGASDNLLEVNFNPHIEGYSASMLEKLCSTSNLALRPPEDALRPLSSMTDFVEFSSGLKELAIELARIANDLILLSSGPSMAEIILPRVACQSSTANVEMPEKAEPVIPEALHMVAFQIISNDNSITLAAQTGQLQANALTPLIIHNILSSMDLLSKMVHSFNQRCVAGILPISHS